VLQGLDAVGGEPQRRHRAEGQKVAAPNGEHVLDLPDHRRGNAFRPGLEHKVRNRVRRTGHAEEGRQRGDEDQQRKHREQPRQGNVTGHGEAVVAGKMTDCVLQHGVNHKDASGKKVKTHRSMFLARACLIRQVRACENAAPPKDL
jgi:hypothetical protein